MSASRHNPQRRRRAARGRKRNQGWIFIGGTLVVLAIIIGIFILVPRQNQQGPVTQTAPARSDIVQTVTHVDPTLLSQIGAGKATNNLKPVQGAPMPLTGPTGKPELLYVGGEFCPYCATERWALVIALSRFGTFHNLKETTSSATDVYPSTPTFSFYQSSYVSSYIDFVGVEVADQQQKPLQPLTAEQQKIFDTYNAPPYVEEQNKGGIPFLDLGNRYIATGPNYDPGVLRTDTQNPSAPALTAEAIASQLTSNNTLSQNVLGAANYYTAAICSLTNDKPANVCSDPVIQQIGQTLAQA